MGNTWICASAGRDDVNDYAGDGAFAGSVNHGDTVIIPAGEETWTEGIACTKGLTIRGSGTGATIIQDAIEKTGAVEDSIFRMSVNSPNQLELGNFTLLGGVEPDSLQASRGHITVTGLSTAPNVRIHHINGTDLDYAFLITHGSIYGLMDHINLDVQPQEATPYLAVIYLEAMGGVGSYGDKSWAEPLTPGGANQFYIEDCTIVGAPEGWGTNPTEALPNLIDGFRGSRVVVRHNRFVRCVSGSHGTETGNRERSCRWWEIYNNRFEFEYNITQVDSVFLMRGGSGVIFNNEISGANVGYAWNSVVKLENKRSVTGFPPWGKCDGTSPYDTEAGDPDGYRCVDQPGAGTSNLLSGATPTEEPVNNALEPFYIWGNTYPGSNGPPASGYVAPTTSHIELDRDYVLDERPGYTPFTYPHPLQGGRKTKRPRASRGRH